MYSRRTLAGFVRHDERITLICSLLHLINFEASYALEKLKFHGKSQLFLARRLAMLALSLFARSAKTSLDSTHASSKQSWRSWQCVTTGRREDGGSTPPWRISFCITLPCFYRTPKHLSQLFHSLSRKQPIISMFYAAEGGRLRAS